MSRFLTPPQMIQRLWDEVQKLKAQVQTAIDGTGRIRSVGGGDTDVGVLRTHPHTGSGEGGTVELDDLLSTGVADGRVPRADGAGTVVFDEDNAAFVAVITNADSADSAKPRIMLPCPFAGTITYVEVKLNEHEVCGATSLIVDVHKQLEADLNTDTHTTLYTTQANRPEVANTERYYASDGGGHSLPDVTTFVQGDWLCFLIDQAGTSVTTITVAVRCKKT